MVIYCGILNLVEERRMDNVNPELSCCGAQEEVIRVVQCRASMACHPPHSLPAENHTGET